MSEVGGRNGRQSIRSFRDLEVFQISLALVKPVYDLVRRFPQREAYDLSDQLRRAAKSIPANIAEGYARKESPKEFKRFLRIALASATEIEVHFDIALALEYITREEYEYFLREYQVLARKLFRLIESWRKMPSDVRPPTSDLVKADELH